MAVDFSKLRWAFTLTQSFPWVASLAGSGPDFAILTEMEDSLPDQYLWSSLHFNDLDDFQSVRDRAVALKALLDGALAILGQHPFQLFELFELTSNRRTRETSGNVLSDPFSKRFVLVSEQIGHEARGNFVGRALFLSRYDEATRGILSSLGVHSATWASLYVVLDYMTANNWSKGQIVKRKLATARDIDRFTHTANSVKAVGPFARHGQKNCAPPKHPMPLAEAEDMVLRAVMAFIEQRYIDLGMGSK